MWNFERKRDISIFLWKRCRKKMLGSLIFPLKNFLLDQNFSENYSDKLYSFKNIPLWIIFIFKKVVEISFSELMGRDKSKLDLKKFL